MFYKVKENKKYLPFLIILLFLLIIIYYLIPRKENFTNETNEINQTNQWSKKLIQDFLKYEQVNNPNIIFDVNEIQKQATEEEVKILLETGKWPWSEETRELYMDAIKNSTILKTSPKESMEITRQIYNQTIMREMLSWNALEGQFLLSGSFYKPKIPDRNKDNGTGTFGINSGLISKNDNLIRCGMNKNKKIVLQEIENQGNDGITGVHKNVTTTFDYNKLPSIFPGFHFINSPCDPCVALNNPPDYSCPFSLTSNEPSAIWSSLWSLSPL